MFDPKSGSCIPLTNVEGNKPVGTLECPEGFVLDEKLGLCVPDSPSSQAQKKFSGKLERCITSVKSSLRKDNSKLSEKEVKSRAIAICRDQLGE